MLKGNHISLVGGHCLCEGGARGGILIYHSAVRLGIDVIALFGEVAEMAPPLMKEILLAFPRRSPEDRSLWAFAYKEAPTKHGVRYEYIA